jgi:hypothetical protein
MLGASESSAVALRLTLKQIFCFTKVCSASRWETVLDTEDKFYVGRIIDLFVPRGRAMETSHQQPVQLDAAGLKETPSLYKSVRCK